MEHRYLKKVDAFIKPYLAKNGYEFITSEFVEEDHNFYLRLFIDLSEEEAAGRLAATEADASAADESGEGPMQAGVSIDDCVKVSRYLSKWLDKEDFISENYTLEVCSRGFLKNDNLIEEV